MSSEHAIRIEKLDRSHDRSGFDCGVTALNRYLQKFANQNTKKGLGVTYVATGADEQTVRGYYTISSGQISCAVLPKQQSNKLPRYPIPVVRIARLATNLPSHRRGIGGMLLIDALQRSLIASGELGVHAVEVDAKSDTAKAFYRKYGFQELRDDHLHLYLPMKTIAALFSVPG